MSVSAESTDDPVPITLVIRTLLGGGAERVMTAMANYWVQHGRAVTIITCSEPETDAYPLDERVRRIQIQQRTWLRIPLLDKTIQEPLCLALRRAISDSGNRLVLSFMDKMNVQCLLVRMVMTFHLMVMERTDPRFYCYLTRFEKLLQKCLYRFADAVLVLTPRIRDQWATKLVPRSRVGVIPNPVAMRPDLTQTPPFALPDRFITAVGRLHPIKGYDLLFKAFRNVVDVLPDVHLVILGEGQAEDRLRKQLKELQLEDRVIMPGEFFDNPQRVMKRAEFLVSTSHIEGMPNVVMEAMACGVPVISFDSPSGGPETIIRHETDGILVPHLDVDRLATTMTDLLQDQDRCAELGMRASEVNERFRIDAIMTLWECAIAQVNGADHFDADKLSTHDSVAVNDSALPVASA